MQEPRITQPGDAILDHYMPNATVEEREAARENLRAYARVILRICTRMAEEERQAQIRARYDVEVKSHDA